MADRKTNLFTKTIGGTATASFESTCCIAAELERREWIRLYYSFSVNRYRDSVVGNIGRLSPTSMGGSRARDPNFEHQKDNSVEHLSQKQFEDYSQSQLQESDLLSVTDHLSECEPCRRQVESAINGDVAFLL
jgi:hypothetical protein